VNGKTWILILFKIYFIFSVPVFAADSIVSAETNAGIATSDFSDGFFKNAVSPSSLAAGEVYSFVNTNEIYEIVKADNYYKPIDLDEFYQEISGVYGRFESGSDSQSNSDSEQLLITLINNLKKIDPNKIHADSVIHNIEKYQSQIVAVIKKEKQLDELLDYLSRLKKVADNKKPSPKVNVAFECRDGGVISDYSWPRASCN